MKVDMSSEAITARLELVSELWRLCLSLGKAKPVANDHQLQHEGLNKKDQSAIKISREQKE